MGDAANKALRMAQMMDCMALPIKSVCDNDGGKRSKAKHDHKESVIGKSLEPGKRQSAKAKRDCEED
jgi:hypothetical protein